MFLNLLNEEEKKAFALLAEKLIEADGLVIGDEVTALGALEGEMGLSSSDAERRPIEKLAAVFSSERSKAIVLLELIGLGYSDNSFCVDERSLVTAAAREMGVSADRLAILERWVKRYVDLVTEAMELIRD